MTIPKNGARKKVSKAIFQPIKAPIIAKLNIPAHNSVSPPIAGRLRS